MKPKYEHDCDRCKFLGSVVINEVEADMWACTEGVPNRNDSLIARFSSRVHDYASSSLACMSIISDPHLLVAFRMYLKHYGANGSSGLDGRIWFRDFSVIDIGRGPRR